MRSSRCSTNGSKERVGNGVSHERQLRFAFACLAMFGLLVAAPGKTSADYVVEQFICKGGGTAEFSYGKELVYVDRVRFNLNSAGGAISDLGLPEYAELDKSVTLLTIGREPDKLYLIGVRGDKFNLRITWNKASKFLSLSVLDRPSVLEGFMKQLISFKLNCTK